MPNPTDYYDTAILEEVRKILHTPSRPGEKPESEQDPHEAVISISDAISIAEGVSPHYDELSAQQKFLVACIADWRQSPDGVKETDRLAREGYWFATDLNMDPFGRHNSNIRLITINPIHHINKNEDLQKTEDHEYRHASYYLDNIGKKPNEGLSSWDVGLAQLAEEGNAHVYEEAKYRQREGLLPLTREEKQKIFTEQATIASLYETYALYSTTRSDGRKLTPEEFAQRFGTIPGDEENFLNGFQDVDDAFLTTQEKNGNFFPEGVPKGAFISAYRAAVQKPVTYENLPPLKAGERRFEGDSDPDRLYVAYLKPSENGAPPTLDLYVRRYNDEKGIGSYVKIASDVKGQAVSESGNLQYFCGSYTAEGKYYEPLRLAMGKDGNVQIWGKAWDIDEQGKYKFYPYKYHETTLTGGMQPQLAPGAPAVALPAPVP